RSPLPRSVTSMSPFGSHAMLHGFLKPSTTVTTLKASPGGPGGCASAEVIQLELAAAQSAADRASADVRRLRTSNSDVACIDVYPRCAPPMVGLGAERNARSKRRPAQYTYV